MKRNLFVKILAVLGGILSATSMFLPVGIFDNSKYGLDPTYIDPVSKSDPVLSGWAIAVAVIIVASSVVGFFVKNKGLQMFSKVFGILGSLFLGGISAVAIFYVGNLKNLVGDKPSLYVGVWLLIVGAVLAFLGSVFTKSKNNESYN